MEKQQHIVWITNSLLSHCWLSKSGTSTFFFLEHHLCSSVYSDIFPYQQSERLQPGPDGPGAAGSGPTVGRHRGSPGNHPALQPLCPGHSRGWEMVGIIRSVPSPVNGGKAGQGTRRGCHSPWELQQGQPSQVFFQDRVFLSVVLLFPRMHYLGHTGLYAAPSLGC